MSRVFANREEAGRELVAGLATDWCVRASVLDARALGYEVVVLGDAVAPVEAHPGDGVRALAEMESAGARLAETLQLEPSPSRAASARSVADTSTG